MHARTNKFFFWGKDGKERRSTGVRAEFLDSERYMNRKLQNNKNRGQTTCSAAVATKICGEKNRWPAERRWREKGTTTRELNFISVLSPIARQTQDEKWCPDLMVPQCGNTHAHTSPKNTSCCVPGVRCGHAEVDRGRGGASSNMMTSTGRPETVARRCDTAVQLWGVVGRFLSS